MAQSKLFTPHGQEAKEKEGPTILFEGKSPMNSEPHIKPHPIKIPSPPNNPMRGDQAFNTMSFISKP
jgi:hypothetical protein